MGRTHGRLSTNSAGNLGQGAVLDWPAGQWSRWPVPPIVDAAEFETVLTLLKTRSPALTALRVDASDTNATKAQ